MQILQDLKIILMPILPFLGPIGIVLDLILVISLIHDFFQ